MDDLRSRLLEAAVAEFGDISPTATRASLKDCFTEEDRRLIFWFNDPRGNTRAIIREKDRQAPPGTAASGRRARSAP